VCSVQTQQLVRDETHDLSPHLPQGLTSVAFSTLPPFHSPTNLQPATSTLLARRPQGQALSFARLSARRDPGTAEMGEGGGEAGGHQGA
jgi:hypothetical protein